MAYTKPQAMVHQEFSGAATATVGTMSAVVVGPNAILHRYSDSSEKAAIDLGEYTGNSETKLYPGRSTGGIVDKSYSKLYVDNALLQYYSDLTISATASGDTPKICGAKGKTNVITSAYHDTPINFVENGSAYPRDSAFGIRDVQIGDYVWIQGNDSGSNDCPQVSLLTKVKDFAPEITIAEIGDVARSANSKLATVSSAVAAAATPASGTTATLTVTGTYNGISAGCPSASYTVSVLSVTSTNACGSRAQVSVTTSTGDDGGDVFTVAGNTSFNIGDYGLSGSLPASLTGVESGDSWTVTAKTAYTSLTAEAMTVSGTYTGTIDDDYIITVIEGGTLAANAPIKVSVSTNSGYSYIPSLSVSLNTATSIGRGLSITFPTSAAMAKGETFTFSVEAEKAGAYNGLVLQNDLPAGLRNASATESTACKGLDIRLFAKRDIVLLEESDVPNQSDNFVQENTQVVISDTIYTYQDDFLTNSGDNITLTLYKGDMYFEYREWSQSYVNTLSYCASVSDLSAIDGQISPDNPLKYGVYKALTNSGGYAVAYVAVSDPDDTTEWSEAFGRINGRDDVYAVIPMSYSTEVQNLALALIESESGSTACRWKSAVLAVDIPDTMKIVGIQDSNSIRTTSSNGLIVKATISDSPYDSGTQYTYVTVTTGNSNFVTYGVRPGDVLKLYNGGSDPLSYVIDSVISEESLILKTSASEISTAMTIEVWRTLNNNDRVAIATTKAQSIANRRVVLVWPNKVGVDGTWVDGYYLAAAIGGLKSGVSPAQTLTRVEVDGFDDYSLTSSLSESQLNTLAENGVLIVGESTAGTPYIRHAVTTNTSDTTYKEEMMTRDYDAVSKYLYGIIDGYIAKTNVTSETISKLYSSLRVACTYLVNNNLMTDVTSLSVAKHDLLSDTIVVKLVCKLPYAVNYIDLYIYNQRG